MGSFELHGFFYPALKERFIRNILMGAIFFISETISVLKLNSLFQTAYLFLFSSGQCPYWWL
jgi:hypothetical protein